MPIAYRYVLTTFILFGSVLMIGIGATRIVRFYALVDAFTVVGSQLVCEQPLNNRCVMHYRVERPGGVVSDFVPFGSQFSSYPLEVGLVFRKDRLGFSYELNYKSERWPAFGGQIRNVLLGWLGILLWWAIGGPKALRGWLSLPLTGRS